MCTIHVPSSNIPKGEKRENEDPHPPGLSKWLLYLLAAKHVVMTHGNKLS